MSYSNHDYFTCDECEESYNLHEKNVVKNACLCNTCYEAENTYTCDNCDNKCSRQWDGRHESGDFLYCDDCFDKLAEQARQEREDDENDFRRATGWV